MIQFILFILLILGLSFGGSKGGSSTVMEILGADSAFNLVDRMSSKKK